MKIKNKFSNFNFLNCFGVYYVYIYYDPRPGKNLDPFYVGKGKGNRIWFHLRLNNVHNQTRNKRKYGVIKSIINEGYYPVIKKYVSNINEKLAYEIELALINAIGTRKDGDGPLTNIENTFSTKRRFYEEDKKETYEKIGAGVKRKWQDPNSIFNSKEYREFLSKKRSGKGNPRYGDHRTWEELYGKEKSDELKKEASKKYKGKGNPRAKKLILESPNGEKIKVHGNIREKCKELNLSYISLYRFKGKPVQNKIFPKKFKQMSINTQGWKLYEDVE